MPWYGEAVDSLLSSGVDFLIGVLRYRIADPKTIVTPVIREQNDSISNGIVPETFYTKNMPIATGYTTVLRIDRWKYDEVNTVVEASGLRAYIFNETSGSFYIPSGAIPGTSGNIIKLSYSWVDEQECKFTDTELRLYIQDAVTTVNGSYYNFSHTVSGFGDTFDIVPSPGYGEISSYLYIMYATYLIRKQLESEGFDNRIFVRDLNVTIDTSKGLGDLTKSSDILMGDFKNILNTFMLRGQESAFSLIDTYSTYNKYDSTYEYEHNYIKDSDF